MSILSDNQIKQLCIAPPRVLDAELYNREMAKPQVSNGIHYTDLRRVAEEAQRAQQKIIDRCMRDATPEELADFRPMISPFHPTSVKTVQYPTVEGNPIREVRATSFGLSSYGYDMTLAEEFRIFSNINSGVINPKNFSEDCLVDGTIHEDATYGRYVIMPPHSYMLGRTVEYLDIPRDIMVICLGKSTYARCGGHVNVTPIEPGFRGHVVIEISNATPNPMMVFANEGIAQFLFLRGDEPCEVSYADRNGKYQNQTGITLPKV